MGKRICIIGGTGFVGRVIARHALQAGHQVVVTSRHPERARDMLVSGIRLLKSDITGGKGIAEAVQGCDTVINLVGLLFPGGRNTFEAAHVDGVSHVIQACKQHGVSQLIHMSALLSEQAVQHSDYGQTKHRAEELVRQSDLNWTIFQPSLIYGEHDSFLMRFKRLSAIGPILPVIAGDTKFQPVWVEDVARAFVQSIGNPQVSKQSYVLAGAQAYSMKAMLDLWMKALGRKRILLPVPKFAAAMLAAVSKLLPVPLITTDQLKLLEYDNVTSGEPFPAMFGNPASFEAVLPVLASGSQPEHIQQILDQARSHYRKS